MNRTGVLFLLMAAGCASAGQKRITDDKLIAQIVKGKSTKADLEKLLGKPTQVDFTDSGLEKWVYMYVTYQMRGTTFIPIVGMFAGGSDTQMDSLTVLFDKNGVVENFGRGQTAGAGGGLQDADKNPQVIKPSPAPTQPQPVPPPKSVKGGGVDRRRALHPAMVSGKLPGAC